MPAYVAGINDTEVGGLAGYRMPMSLEQANGWLERVNETSKKGRGSSSRSASWATTGSSAPPG